MFNRHYMKQLVERAVKTFAQALAAILVASGAGLLDADWTGALSAAGMAALISALTSLGSGYIGDDSPSLVDQETNNG